MQDRHMFFRMGTRRMAIPASRVKEIVNDLPSYPVPFTPAWVKGVLNRHGEPYTVLDLRELEGEAPVEGAIHVLLNLHDDQLALRIDEVLEIRDIDPGSIKSIDSAGSSRRLWSGMVGEGEKQTLVVDVQGLRERLADDLASV